MVEHQGKKIYFIDFSNLQNSDEINLVIKEARIYIDVQPQMSLYTLTSIDGMHFNNTIKEMFTDFVKKNKPYVKASAVIGVSGLKQIVFNGIMKLTGRDVRSFATMEGAKDWLVQQK